MTTVEATVDAALHVNDEYVFVDPERFECPTLEDLWSNDEHPCFRWLGESLRWYTMLGVPRPRPLDLDELIEELVTVRGLGYREAEWVACFESRALSGDAEAWERLQQSSFKTAVQH